MWVRSLVLVSLLFAGCSLVEGDNADGGTVSPPPPSVAEGQVVIRGTAYNPARVEIAVGRELVWSFQDDGLDHSVTADDASFDSGRLGTGEFRRVFTVPGEVAYHCQVHARMKGTVVVVG